MSKMVVINNPAAKHGGVLTILKELLNKISTLNCNRKFLVVVSLEELKKYENKNIKIEVIPKQNFKDRIIWDNFKINKYLKKNKINPEIFISLQNTGVNIDKNIIQIIYYQQSLSLTNLKWSIFKKNQRLYWMYKNIYPIFTKQYLNKIKKVIVQTEWVKEEFSRKFNYSKENINVIKPQIKKIDMSVIKNIPKNKFRIFYPAAPLIYKNHKIILEAIRKLKEENSNLENEIECIFTFNKGDNLELDKLIEKYDLKTIIKLIGQISYNEVLEYYKSSDLLVFSSYLETFGLPLLEAQQFNLNILTVDLPYSREVIGSYTRSKFITYNNSNEWYREIRNKIKVKL